MSKKFNDGPVCGLDYAFRRIGGKYKARIIWYVFNADNVLRHGELMRKIQNITPKMLTQCLRELEHDGLLHREVYRQVPPRVEYSVTETGKELLPFIEHLAVWGAKRLKHERA
ncbi:MAG: helix-turn-helix domain-containing protein [Myxococcota bacterium]